VLQTYVGSIGQYVRRLHYSQFFLKLSFLQTSLHFVYKFFFFLLFFFSLKCRMSFRVRQSKMFTTLASFYLYSAVFWLQVSTSTIAIDQAAFGALILITNIIFCSNVPIL